MGRSEDAKVWANVLTELAHVEVTVQWERPAWRVRWQDCPTRQVLMDRAAALNRYRVAAVLPVEQLRFARRDSPVAIALGWLAQGSPGSPARAGATVPEVEAYCADTGNPRTRFDDRTIASADLVSRLDGVDGGAAEPGHPTPGHAAAGHGGTGPAGPGDQLPLAQRRPTRRPPRPHRQTVARHRERTAGGGDVPAVRAVRSTPAVGGPRRHRPAKYCSGACRTAAHWAVVAGAEADTVQGWDELVEPAGDRLGE